MPKTDDFIKELLMDSIVKTTNLKTRVFLGTSTQDQDLWVDGGLTFGFGGCKYGSCDFAWYSDDTWRDPYSGRTCNARPVVVVEGTDCLNTRSWGNAQIQRFHHVYGAALCGVTGVYFLNRGEHEIRHYLFAAAYYATKYLQSRNSGSRYLVIDDLGELNSLVQVADKKGIESDDFITVCGEAETKMLKRFETTFLGSYGGNWDIFLESRDVHKTPSGWVKILGPEKENFTNPSKRMGHIVIGEALTTQFLLMGSGKLRQSGRFFYLLPLMSRRDVEELDLSRTRDKEWALLRKDDNPWQVVALDGVVGVSATTREAFERLKGTNRNLYKGELSDAKRQLVQELMSGKAFIKPKVAER